jgi:hypothetical protein
LIQETAGNLFGTVLSTNPGCECGAIIRVVPSTGVEAEFYGFNGASGLAPEGGVIQDSKGNLYGTLWHNLVGRSIRVRNCVSNRLNSKRP